MRLRLILSFSLIVLVSVSSFFLIAQQTTSQEINTFMFHGGITGSEGLVEALEDHYAMNHTWVGAENLIGPIGFRSGNRPNDSSSSSGMMGGMMNQHMRLVDVNGNLIYDSANPNATGSLNMTELQGAIPLEVNGNTVGYLLPEGGVRLSHNVASSLVNRLNQLAIYAGLVAGAVSLVVALLLAYRLLRPVRELTYGSQQIAKGDLSYRVPVRGDDELARLGYTFNQMAESLEHSEESRQALTADIAHELRTPLAVQRANLEALQDSVYPMTAENLEPIIEQNHLLTRLVDDLRTLALADAGQLSLEIVPTDLPRLIRRVVDRFTPQADIHGIRIEASIIDEPHRDSGISNLSQIPLDAGRVEQILGNILSNALRHTPEDGHIEVTLDQTEKEAQLRVHDNGPGIPEEALSLVFERFYRADKSRSRSEGGTGLGLAIAKQMAEANGGTLIAANHADGGAIFTLSFPLISQ
jgi:signal transduction histidine kinase